MLLLVANPTAQSGKNAARIDKARRALNRHGLLHDFLPTAPNGETVQQVSNALQRGTYKMVIAMGGDGTFAEVGKGLIRSGTQIPMGMLPTGTANDQGRSFGLSSAPDALEHNVAVLAAGYTAPLDAGHIEALDFLGHPVATDWFFDSAGWGMSARTLQTRNKDRRLVESVPLVREVYRDRFVYAGALLRTFMQSWIEEQRFEAEVITPKGRVFLSSLTDLVVKNTRYYAGAWVFDETASPEDGEMELVPFSGQNEWLARAVVNLDGLPVHEHNLQTVGLSLSEVIRAPRFEIHIQDRPLSSPIESQLDGEEWSRASRFLIEVKKHAITLCCPAPESR